MKTILLVMIILISSAMYSQGIDGFYLSRYSPVINMGTMSAWPGVGPVDFYGQPRLQGRSLDMGASEFQDRWERIVTARISADATIIKGDSIKIMASGGKDYTWNTGQTTRTITVAPLVTTTYDVLVNQYGTTSNASVTITVIDNPNPLVPIANAGDDMVLCSNTEILLSVPFEPTATYLWNTGDTTNEIRITPTQTMIISVEITQNLDTSSDTVIIYVDENCN